MHLQLEINTVKKLTENHQCINFYLGQEGESSYDLPIRMLIAESKQFWRHDSWCEEA